MVRVTMARMAFRTSLRRLVVCRLAVVKAAGDRRRCLLCCRDGAFDVDVAAMVLGSRDADAAQGGLLVGEDRGGGAVDA
ncbi:hypothetical protein [Actinokineospora pegani]|uniref:hypothetical protein n=1 Tax=Actinokineospora pegani TaxID=2654637 RepID=UPI0018D3599E|nr:hypothetical protein [Actinokineospora pegani]